MGTKGVWQRVISDKEFAKKWDKIFKKKRDIQKDNNSNKK
jgi:hypothetical protein